MIDVHLPSDAAPTCCIRSAGAAGAFDELDGVLLPPPPPPPNAEISTFGVGQPLVVVVANSSRM